MYLFRQVLQSIVVLLLVTVITFGLLRMIPGNAAVAVMGPGIYRDPGAIRVFNADYGFNLPWHRQYLFWLGNLLRGNLGYSWQQNQSVSSLLAQQAAQDPPAGRAGDPAGARRGHPHRHDPGSPPQQAQ